MESYYVVKRGHKTGIYKTWLECKSAVDGFKSPIFRKFSSFEEANNFYKADIPVATNTKDSTNTQVKDTNNQPEKIILTDSSGIRNREMPANELAKVRALCVNIKSAPFSDDLNYNISGWNSLNNEIYIFTDGSARKTKNGFNEGFNSGLGVYLGYQCINIKEQYLNRTNNQCELGALDYAFKLIVRYWRELSEISKPIKIVSDSEYSIKAVSVWLTQWKKNNWKTSSGESVKNRELIESIDSSMIRIKTFNANLEDTKKIRVKLIHVNSHQVPDLQDKFKYSIWFGNYVADGLSQDTI
jgi:ribonuclease HI